MKWRHSIIFIASLIVIGCIARPVFAAELFFQPNNQTFARAQEFTTNVFLNSENQLVNAVEGSIVFPDNLLEIKAVQDSNSIINFWVQQPNTGQPGMITFSGIIPGGYLGPKGLIFSLIFKTKAKGSGTVAITNANILLNDGKGTAATVKLSPYSFSVSDAISTSPIVEPPKDTQSPEAFKPEIAKSPDLFNGKWFLVFATQDKGSGIDHYEIKEGTQGNFIVAQSPYLLQNQQLNQEIFVKAVDKNGNERLETVYPQNWHPWYNNYWIFGILILGIVFVTVIISIFAWKKPKK